MIPGRQFGSVRGKRQRRKANNEKLSGVLQISSCVGLDRAGGRVTSGNEEKKIGAMATF